MVRFMMLMGIPGCGKSTLARDWPRLKRWDEVKVVED